MSHRPIHLAAMLATLRAARTPAAMAAATADVYVAVLPSFTRVCDRLLDRPALTSWKTGEDLAEDTLVDALPALQRGACPHVHDGGLLRWLAAAARCDLVDAARRTGGTSDDDIVDVLRATHARNAASAGTDVHPSPSHRAFRVAYARALAALPPTQHAAWELVVEQEAPLRVAASALGVVHTTVLRRVRQARAHLVSHLAPFAR